MKAIIIGSGIAGPLTALALHKAGIEACVYEGYTEERALAGAGAWLTVAVNGLDAMRTLGVHEAVLRRGFPARTIELCNGTGKLLGKVPLGGSLADGTVTHSLRRADLHAALHGEAMGRGIPFTFGERLRHAEPRGPGVVATFESGLTVEGDLLIGADGLHSRVRHLIDPRAPEPRFRGLGNLGGFTRHVPAELEPGVYRMMFGKRCFFGFTLSPDGELWWFANPQLADEREGRPNGKDAALLWKARLLELLCDDHPVCSEIVRHTEQVLVGGAQYDLPRVRSWQRGPMVILGDAAHAVSPASGQGASLAAEDAVELARCVRDVPALPEALRRFEQQRRQRVEKIVAEGARRDAGKLAGPLGRLVRDALMPPILRWAAKRGEQGEAWIFRHHIPWEARVAPC